MKKILASIVMCVSMSIAPAFAKNVGSVDTNFNLIGNNGTIEVDYLKDPEVQGVTCHLSYAKAGGISGSLGLAQDPSRFSIACRQTGPLVLPVNIEKQKEVNAFSRNIFFKEMLVTRMYDKENKTLIYLVHSKKLLDGSPFNAISTIPVMNWNGVEPVIK